MTLLRVEVSPGVPAPQMFPRARSLNRVPVSPQQRSGIVILERDDPSVRRGSTFTCADGAGCTISGTVSRRLRRRDGTLKLWLDVLSVAHRW